MRKNDIYFKKEFTPLETLRAKKNHPKNKSLTGFTPLDSKRLTGFTPTSSFLLSKGGAVDNRKKKNLMCGFSLIEMLVSIALFSVIMVIAIGIIITTLNTNKHVRSTSVAIGNVDAVMEKIFREASVGSYYHCRKEGKIEGNIEKARDCPGGNPLTVFIFEGVGGDEGSKDDQIIYRLNSTDFALEVSRDGGANFERLTDENIIIDDFNVNVVGNIDDTKQPAVFIGMRGYIKKGEDSKTVFAVQTMISERFNTSILR